MDIIELSDAVGQRFAQERKKDPIFLQSPPGLGLFEMSAETAFEATIYSPVSCLILQGAKQIAVGERSVTLHAGESLIVGHDLPVSSRVTAAAANTPYRAIVVGIDLEVVRSLYDQVDETAFQKGADDVLGVNQTDPALIDALGRYLALADKPAEAKVMAPLIFREIHYRLLIAPHGGMLRRLLRRDSHASRIGLAIEKIRKDFRAPIPVASLAAVAGMSVSSFHDHFRAITETTPLQFQKDLRLLEARRLLSQQGMLVSSAAFDVGYESPTQFSREYTRKFGVPPKAHVGAELVAI